ncbi:MAG: YajQ family cyclic di-GMP-binding protein [Pseudomonadota bacterium]
MPSFDVVSELDHHEISNAIDQANREVSTRFDFKNTESCFELSDPAQIVLKTSSEFQLQQMLDILYAKLSRRGIDLAAVEAGENEVSGQTYMQAVALKEGIDSEQAKAIVKHIKQSKLKLQAAIQGDQVRVTGKKRDALQSAIALLKQTDFDRPLQFKNFRD